MNLLKSAITLILFLALVSCNDDVFPDFVIAYPKNHLQIKGQCVDAVS